MTPVEIAPFIQLGIGGFAIFIMYKIHQSNAEANKVNALRMKEKDQELIAEIDKRDTRNENQQRAFNEHVTKVHESMTKQLSENTKALTYNASALHENTKVMQRVQEHLGTPHGNVVINNPAPKI
jgi:hypothetical protein